MNTLHALLARQVKRHFGTLESLPAEYRAFVREVDEAYRELETDRGMLERALDISSEEQMQANAQMRALLEAFPDLYLRLDAQGHILEYKAGSASDAFAPAGNRVGKFIQAVPQKDVAEKFQAAIEQVGRTGSMAAIEYFLKGRSAEEHYEARLVPLPEGEIFVIIRHITERKQAEMALKASEFFLQRSQAVASIGSYYLNALTGYWLSSHALEEIFGIDASFPKNISGWISLVHPEDRDEMLRYLQDHVLVGRNRFDREYRIIRNSDQQERWVHGLGELEYDGQGNTIKMIGTVQDITERRRSEAALLELKEQLAATLNALPDLLFAVDRDGRILDYRAPSADKLYLAPEQFLGRQVRDVLPPEAAAAVMGAVSEAFKHGVGSGATYSLRKGELTEWFELTAARQGRCATRDARVIVLVRDVTKRKQAEEGLRRSDARLQEAVRVSNIGIFEHDHETGAIFWSPEMRKSHGWGPDEPVTVAGFVRCVHPEDRDGIAQAVRRAHDPAGDGRYDVEYRVIRADGAIRWLVTRSQTVFEGEGAARHPVRTSGVALDFTQRQEASEALKESEERLRLALTATQQGLYDLNVQTGEAVVSPEYALMLGYEPATFQETNERWRERLHPDDREAVYRAYTDCISGRTSEYRVELRQRSKGGEWKWILSLGKVVATDAQGRPLRMLGTHTDITSRKLAEEEVRKARDELEVRVQERTAQLQQARLAAEAASEAKSRFLAMMSHEIRTPLNGVTGVLHLLQKEGLTAQQQRWIEMANTSAGTLLSVINDVLDFSKVEAGRLDLHVVATDLHSTVKATADTFTGRAVDKGLAWSLSVDPQVPRYVLTDGDRLTQVLGNLLSNAIKFTDAGKVSLRVTPGVSQPDHIRVRFEVIDTGVGVGAEHLERLFKPFFQVDDSTTRRHGGTGLGLGICKHLVELMGGTIGVVSEAGKGSTFWFDLPLKAAASGPESQPAESIEVAVTTPSAAPLSAPQQPLGRVLLAEDNEINQELAREMILFAGCECDCVVNGREAVRAAATGRYDMVIMDCMMPEMDGYAATQAIRAEEARRAASGHPPRHFPIIALTANAMEGDRRECLAAGMDDYLTKPFDPEEVGRVIRKWLPPGLPSPTKPSAQLPRTNPGSELGIRHQVSSQ